MDEPVIPFDHVTVPLQPLAVTVANPVAQLIGPAVTVGGAVTVMVGQVGAVTGTDGALVQPLAVQVAV